MGNTSRHHHFIPRFYLKGFLFEAEENPRLAVIDLKKKKQFQTNTRNVGAIRDFNRVDVEVTCPRIMYQLLLESCPSHLSCIAVAEP
ncbi:hypothetical protein STSP2_00390 [Anaerohalosphaera lusitana]|uniref:DUF4238 domain-containing protein n=1 Tax=Anaerohalosphaera lusitana TaxID=1936003 RepID=A0A1U9NHJ7_9BACT|nr:hypothetical protein STSP2_00390 [Anaerohalosphaera lusitana]